jgi:glycosyltransferase involved in cell wall biosynthesis
MGQPPGPRPLVSVITPVFNPGPLLAPAIESLLRQSVSDIEILAVDDGSTDGSREWLQELATKDVRVRVILHAENRRAPVARNAAIAVATGEFIAFQNHDDRSQPGRFERQVAFLRGHPAHGAVVSAVEFLDPSGRPNGRPSLPSSDQIENRWAALMECPFHLSSLMVRGSLLRENVSLRFDPSLTHRSDYGFQSQLLAITGVGVIPETLVRYVLHPGSVSRSRTETMQRQGDIIAHRAIQREVPDCPLRLEEVSEMRGIILHLPGSFSRSLAATKRAWANYLALRNAFRTRYTLDASRALPEPIRHHP